MHVSSSIGTVPPEDNRVQGVITAAEPDRTYRSTVRLPGSLPAHDVEIDDTEGVIHRVRVDYDVPSEIVYGTNLFGEAPDFAKWMSPGRLDVFLLDGEAYAKYQAGEPFTASVSEPDVSSERSCLPCLTYGRIGTSCSLTRIGWSTRRCSMPWSSSLGTHCGDRGLERTCLWPASRRYQACAREPDRLAHWLNIQTRPSRRTTCPHSAHVMRSAADAHEPAARHTGHSRAARQSDRRGSGSRPGTSGDATACCCGRCEARPAGFLAHTSE